MLKILYKQWEHVTVPQVSEIPQTLGKSMEAFLEHQPMCYTNDLAHWSSETGSFLSLH